MALIRISDWWTAREIPLTETDWRNIRLYCQQDVDPFEWERCLYFVRLAPPYSILYRGDRELQSPLVYVGSGKIKDRWSTHRDWLYELGHAIPGGRYEVWVCQSRLQRTAAFYKDIEADILLNFRTMTGCLPLRNLKIEGTPRKHTFKPGFLRVYQGGSEIHLDHVPIRSGEIRDFYNAGSKDG